MDLALLRQRLRPDEAPAEALGRQVPAEAIGTLATSDDAAGLIQGPYRPAAVLVPIVHGAHPGILLTLRTATLSSHAGQVAFPGGRIDPGDASPEAAALREAQEEIGLDPAAVELAGRLPDYVTGTGYLVSPVLGLLAEGAAYAASPDEVDEVFILPMATLLDPAAPERRVRQFRGRDRHYWVWPHERHYIWGATAAILVHLAARLRSRAA